MEKLQQQIFPKQRGQQIENIAITFLKKNKLNILQQNFFCRFGEIDIIAKDNKCLVFIEVRYREKATLETILESVHYHKQRKLILTARYYLQRHPSLMQLPARFDVLAVKGIETDLTFHWIKNAFS